MMLVKLTLVDDVRQITPDCKGLFSVKYEHFIQTLNLEDFVLYC